MKRSKKTAPTQLFEKALSRRRVLELTAQGAGGLLVGCTFSGTENRVGSISNGPASTPMVGGQMIQETNTDLGPVTALTKEPWARWTGTMLELCFETREDVPLAVTIESNGGEAQAVEVVRRTDDIEFHNIDLILGPENDEEGPHTFHRAQWIPGPTPQHYQWTVELGGGETKSGSFTYPMPKDEPFTFVWMADSMFPAMDSTVAALVPQNPKLILHGGDLQYRPNPLDSWNGFFNSISPLTKTASLFACIGNHEFEGTNEDVEMFDRLFQGQGEEGRGRYFSLRLGSVCVLMLDSETDDADYGSDAQRAWVEETLSAASADPDIKQIIVGMHRPMYSLSKYYRKDYGSRDALLPLLAQYGVQLVLCGHNHSTEYFLMDGVHYVVDGGAGAALYDPDEKKDDAEAEWPELVAARRFSSESHGATCIDVAADGALTVRRIAAEDGTEQHRFTIPPQAG